MPSVSAIFKYHSTAAGWTQIFEELYNATDWKEVGLRFMEDYNADMNPDTTLLLTEVYSW